MGRNSRIGWTVHTHAFWYGCHHMGLDCEACYAEWITTKLWKKDFNKPWRNDKHFYDPLDWRDHALVFACSMSDFFLNEADPWRDEAWRVIRETPHLTWQILSKRSHRIVDCLPLDWGKGYENVWLGASCGLRQYYDRIENLVKVPAKLHFLSLEPLLESLPDLPLDGIEWVIVGGESGSRHRPMQLDWVREIRYQCRAAHIPFYYKQPAHRFPEQPALLDGQEIKQMPLVEVRVT